ncbi:hypothetical protein H4219_004458 [Mycoemilia scoparia]|uniref:Protein kinase domain-containing protein n=1 Tax=Mycoemilia scoparia TaxID=417184 RepID=A0A9W7ZZR5_9FUNG|nr:hypothetical protein H4219_004458 [Mycoemilia scoparia]
MKSKDAQKELESQIEGKVEVTICQAIWERCGLGKRFNQFRETKIDDVEACVNAIRKKQSEIDKALNQPNIRPEKKIENALIVVNEVMSAEAKSIGLDVKLEWAIGGNRAVIGSSIKPDGALQCKGIERMEWRYLASILEVKTRDTEPTIPNLAQCSNYVQRCWSAMPRKFVLALVVMRDTLYLTYWDRGEIISMAKAGPIIPSNSTEDSKMILEGITTLLFTTMLSEQDLGLIFPKPPGPSRMLILNKGNSKIPLSGFDDDKKHDALILKNIQPFQSPRKLQGRAIWVTRATSETPISIQSSDIQAIKVFVKFNLQQYNRRMQTEIDILKSLAVVKNKSISQPYYTRKLGSHHEFKCEIMVFPDYGIPVDEYLVRIAYDGGLNAERIRSIFGMVHGVIIDTEKFGILHRDISAANIIVRYDQVTGQDIVTVIDWGYAFAKNPKSKHLSHEDFQITGTTPFMSIRMLRMFEGRSWLDDDESNFNDMAYSVARVYSGGKSIDKNPYWNYSHIEQYPLERAKSLLSFSAFSMSCFSVQEKNIDSEITKLLFECYETLFGGGISVQLFLADKDDFRLEKSDEIRSRLSDIFGISNDASATASKAKSPKKTRKRRRTATTNN